MATESFDSIKYQLCTQPLIQASAQHQKLPKSNVEIPSWGSGPPQLALDDKWLWPNGKRIKVSFFKGFEGKEAWRKKIEILSKQWDSICNLELDFGDYGDAADVRVAFRWDHGKRTPDTGSWSFVGSYCLKRPRDEPTMNFGWITDDLSATEFASVVLHEFGHALGCVHEHQNPSTPVIWNEDKVIEAYSGSPNFWDKEAIKTNILTVATTSAYSVFDPDSIMLYSFPAELTKNDLGTHRNTKLSDTDKQYIRQMYPPQIHDAGIFDSTESASSTATSPSGGTFTKEVMFSPKFNETPSIALGLSGVEIGPAANARVLARIDRVDPNSAVVSVNSWDDTQFQGAQVSWIEAAKDDVDFQIGSFQTWDVHPWSKPQAQTSKKLYFPQSYSEPPKVLVMLKSFDMKKGFNYRIKAYTTDIKSDSFVIHIDSWDDTVLFSASASWIAYPADKASVLGGVVESKNPSPQSGITLSERIDFAPGSRAKPPIIQVFLNMLDFDGSKALKIRASVDQVTKDGFNWAVDIGEDSLCYGAGLTYFA